MLLVCKNKHFSILGIKLYIIQKENKTTLILAESLFIVH